jgi:hypothetical protein
MNSFHWWRRIRLAVTAVVGMLVVGCVSSFMSREQCESMTADRVARQLGTRDVFVLAIDASSSVDYPGSEAILRKSGFTVRRCAGSPLACLPGAAVARAEVVYPFLVDVRWGFVAAPTMGVGTRSRYLTLFGAVFPLMDTGDWPVVV